MEVSTPPSAQDILRLIDAASPSQRQKLEAALNQSGLFDFDRTTRRAVWVIALGVLGTALLAAATLIAISYGVPVTTTTGTGATAVTVTSRPDMSAAWAVVSAVVAGVVGLLVPTPQK